MLGVPATERRLATSRSEIHGEVQRNSLETTKEEGIAENVSRSRVECAARVTVRPAYSTVHTSFPDLILQACTERNSKGF